MAGSWAVTVEDGLDANLAAELRAWKAPRTFDAVAVPWTLLTRDANPGKVDLLTAVARRDGAICAVAIVHVVRRLAVGDYTGGALGAITSWTRRIGYTPLTFDVAYLEVPFTNLGGMCFAPNLGDGDRAALWDEVLDALDSHLRCDALCVKGTVDDAIAAEVLRARGMMPLPFADLHMLEIPGETPSYDAWLEQRTKGRRSSIRSTVRRFAKEGGTLETLLDPSPVADDLAALFARTCARARRTGELPLPMSADAAFYRSFAKRMGDRAAVRVARVGGRLAGFLVHAYAHDTLFMKFVGMDYERSVASQAYFRLFHDAVEQAALRGLRHVDMGTTTFHVKGPLGCVRRPACYHVEFRRALRPVGPIFRRLLARRFGEAASSDVSETAGPPPP